MFFCRCCVYSECKALLVSLFTISRVLTYVVASSSLFTSHWIINCMQSSIFFYIWFEYFVFLPEQFCPSQLFYICVWVDLELSLYSFLSNIFFCTFSFCWCVQGFNYLTPFPSENSSTLALRYCYCRHHCLVAFWILWYLFIFCERHNSNSLFLFLKLLQLYLKFSF